MFGRTDAALLIREIEGMIEEAASEVDGDLGAEERTEAHGDISGRRGGGGGRGVDSADADEEGHGGEGHQDGGHDGLEEVVFAAHIRGEGRVKA